MTELEIKEVKPGGGKDTAVRMQPSVRREGIKSWLVGSRWGRTGVEFERHCGSPGKQAGLRQWEFSWHRAP